MNKSVAEIKLWWHLLTNFHQRYAEQWQDRDGSSGRAIGCWQCKRRYWAEKAEGGR